MVYGRNNNNNVKPSSEIQVQGGHASSMKGRVRREEMMEPLHRGGGGARPPFGDAGAGKEFLGGRLPGPAFSIRV